MAEWSKAAVLKTVVGQLTGGSNPSPSVSAIDRVALGEMQEWPNWAPC